MDTPAITPLTKIMDMLMDAICVVDVDGRYLFVSAAFERIFGYAPDEVIGRRMIELVHPEDRDMTLRMAADIMAGKSQSHFQNRYIRKDGEVVHIMWSARWSETDRVRIAVARDISALKRSESVQSALHAISEAAHATDNLSALFEQIHRIIAQLLPAPGFFAALLDPKRGELSFPYFADERAELSESRRNDSDLLTAQVIRTGRSLLLTPASTPDPALPLHSGDAVHWLGVPLTSRGNTIGALVVQSYSDATRYTDADKDLLQFVSIQVAAAVERKQAEARLHHIARHDPLTDLANRDMFYQQFDAALDKARRASGFVTLLYIDLDKFKQVNDRYGHQVGDLLLCEVAHRIRHSVRQADIIGRVGGDEFVVLLTDLQSPADSLAVAEKVRMALDGPFHLADQTVQISTSIGVAAFPRHGDDAKQLTRAADHAMYGVKKRGGNRVGLAAAPDPQRAPGFGQAF